METYIDMICKIGSIHRKSNWRTEMDQAWSSYGMSRDIFISGSKSGL